MSAGIVYLRTNRFEVKLEGITFKARDFETVICSNDFLFPEGKIWARPPIVGIDVMRHPRDPSIVLLLLCFGVGCVILKFHSGDTLPESISKFLMNERIQFVGFGVPEKKDLFPFVELGLNKNKVDIGYLAAKIFDNPKYKRCELAELARKVLRVKTMIGLTEASSFERHEQIKCSICQLFITWAISMVLLRTNNEKIKKSDNNNNDSPKKLSFLKDNNNNNDSPKKLSFLKHLNSLPHLTEGWFKLDKFKKENDPITTIKSTKSTQDDLCIGNLDLDDEFGHDDNNMIKSNKKGWNSFIQATMKASDYLRDQVNLIANKDFSKGGHDLLKTKSVSESRNRSFNDGNPSNKDKPLKGILKCPVNSNPHTPNHQRSQELCSGAKPSLRRSVSFK